MAPRRRPRPLIEQLGPFEIPGLPPRSVRIYVPSDLDPSLPRRALYLFDGQNVFDDAPSFAGGWRIHEAIERLSDARTFSPVVIGIEHGGERRLDELSPWKGRAGGGMADVLLDWLVGELIPLVQPRYGLLPGPVGAAVGGSSMGGLAALYAHFRHPGAFGGALCLSPSLWFARGAIFRCVARSPLPPISRVYLDCGELEDGRRMFGLARRMAEELTARGYPRHQLLWRPDARGAHDERSWRRRIPGALRFMFRR